MDWLGKKSSDRPWGSSKADRISFKYEFRKARVVNVTYASRVIGVGRFESYS